MPHALQCHHAGSPVLPIQQDFKSSLYILAFNIFGEFSAHWLLSGLQILALIIRYFLPCLFLYSGFRGQQSYWRAWAHTTWCLRPHLAIQRLCGAGECELFLEVSSQVLGADLMRSDSLWVCCSCIPNLPGLDLAICIDLALRCCTLFPWPRCPCYFLHLFPEFPHIWCQGQSELYTQDLIIGHDFGCLNQAAYVRRNFTAFDSQSS